MQLRYVASELATGLKRNVSMTIAVILTIFISLTLVGAGLLLRSQVGMIQDDLGSRLELKIVFCSKNSQGDACVQGPATPQQEAVVKQTLEHSDYVADYRYENRQQAFENFKAQYEGSGTQQETILLDELHIKPSDMATSYWATLANPNDNVKLISQVENLPGVDSIIDQRALVGKVYDILHILQLLALGGALALVCAAVLQVANTIRLAAMARRREIGIMRLVGASTLYIQLPFLLEILIAALIGAALACGAIVATRLAAVPWLRQHVTAWPWVGWHEARFAMLVIVAIAILLATVPTLLMTRKYLKV
jgi:cell division transport system permease protein